MVKFTMAQNLFSFASFSFIILILRLCSLKNGAVLAEPANVLQKDRTLYRFSPRIDFYPQELKAVIEDEIRAVSFGISWENITDSFVSAESSDEFQLLIQSENPDVLKLVNSSYPLCIQSKDATNNFTFYVKGVFLGFTKVIVSILPSSGACQSDVRYFLATSGIGENIATVRKFELSVSVIRRPSVLVIVVTGIMAALVAFNYINMGVQLDLSTICKTLKKPIGPSIGFVCQFLFMPLASYGISWLLLDDVSLRLGLFTLGCSPGGSMSNFWTLLFNGDVNLSVTMTFISTIAALGMMPLWIFTLGSSLFRDREATIPYLNLAGSLIGLTIPIGFGLLIQQYSPRLSNWSKKIIKPVTIVCVLFGIFVGLYANSFVFKLFSWQVILSGIGIAWGGYTFGALMAWIFRLDRSQIIAVSIETAFQNPAVAFVMLLMSLPQPEADLTSVPVIAQLMLTGLPMWALLAITRTYDKIKKLKTPKEEPEKPDIVKEYIAVDTNIPVELMSDEHYPLDTSPQKIQIVRFTS